MNTVTLLNGVTTTGSGSGVPMAGPTGNPNTTYLATVTGSGAVSATITIDVAEAETGPYLSGAATISLSGTTSASDGVGLSVNWPYVRATVSAISGSSAAVTVVKGAQ